MTTPRHALRGALVLALALGAFAATPPTALEAQARGDVEVCRCVDRDGNEIENCTCLRRRGPAGLLDEIAGRRNRARLGITVDPDQAAEHDSRGARITDLLEGGPADEAGLEEGDIVTSLAGRSLFDPLDRSVEADFDLDRSIPVQRLLAIARGLEPETEVEVEYLRDGESGTTTLTTEELADWGSFSLRSDRGGIELSERMRELGQRLRGEEEGRWRFALPGREGAVRVEPGEGRSNVIVRRYGDARGGLAFGDGRFSECPASERERGMHVFVWGDGCPGGLELVELRPGLAEYFGTEGGTLVADVHPDSPLGLQPGDVILRIGEREADSPERVRRILRSYEADEEISFHVVRRNEEITLRGRLLVN